jgi:zinc/manganese transport system ATP-binding protein
MPPTSLPTPAPTTPSVAPPAVEVRGAEVRLGGRTIWSDLDLTVAAGEFIAVLGPNGAGKSTLLRALLGLQPLAAGELRVFGAPAGARNREIGYLPQRRAFGESTPIRGWDLVRLGLDGHRWGFPVPGARRWSARARAAHARVEEVIELVGASAYARRPIGELSGGEQQRLLIAQALVRRPRMLILDEPLDGLDLPHQAAVAGLVQRVCRTEGVAVLLVAHDVNPLLPFLDRVVYLAGGRGVTGTPAEVVTSATLSALYGSEIEVLRTASGRLVVVGQPEGVAHHHACGDRDEHGHVL